MMIKVLENLGHEERLKEAVSLLSREQKAGGPCHSIPIP